MSHEAHLRELSLEIDCLHDHTAALDPGTASLVRLAALVAIAGPGPSIHREVDAALGTGITAAQVVAVLDDVAPVVGRPRVVAAAPLVAQALGVELDSEIDSDPDAI